MYECLDNWGLVQKGSKVGTGEIMRNKRTNEE
jgi:hypothetical protein